MAPSNRAAWLVAKEKSPLEVKSSTYPIPNEHEIVIQTRAVAINPVDHYIQLKELWPLPYPATLGCDCAGVVVQIGSQVTSFKPGDRVTGIAGGQSEIITGRVDDQTLSRCAFQEYVLLKDHVSCKIPNAVSFEEAAVLPLGLNTAAAGLFSPNELALSLPTPNPTATGKTILIWGAATSVGINAVQLSVAAGLEVIATASPHNHDHIQRAGAAQVFDYRDASIEQKIIAAFKGKACAGALDASGKAGEACSKIVAEVDGRKYVACAQMPPDEGYVKGVEAKFIIAPSVDTLDFGRAIWGDFLPQALANGSYDCLPKPKVVGQGLEHVQTAFNIYRQGEVSASKLVVSI